MCPIKWRKSNINFFPSWHYCGHRFSRKVCVHVGRRPQIPCQLKSVNFHEAQKRCVIKRKILLLEDTSEYMKCNKWKNLSDWWLKCCWVWVIFLVMELMIFDGSVRVWVSELKEESCWLDHILRYTHTSFDSQMWMRVSFIMLSTGWGDSP